jgi:hypothetical protein
MLTGTVFQSVSLLMVLILPASMIAADRAGLMLIPGGDTFVNGSAGSRPRALFDGDRIKTTKAAGMITMPASSIQVAPSSDVKVSRSDVKVFDGEAVINTSGDLGAHITNLTIRPNAHARYSVGRSGDNIVIGALEGTVQVTDGRDTRTVPTGMALVAKLGPLDSAQDQNAQSQTSTQASTGQQPTDQDQNRRRRRGAGGGAIPGAGVGVTVSAAELRAIGIGVAVAGAVLAIILTNRKPASPTQ